MRGEGSLLAKMPVMSGSGARNSLVPLSYTQQEAALMGTELAVEDGATSISLDWCLLSSRGIAHCMHSTAIEPVVTSSGGAARE